MLWPCCGLSHLRVWLPDHGVSDVMITLSHYLASILCSSTEVHALGSQRLQCLAGQVKACMQLCMCVDMIMTDECKQLAAEPAQSGIAVSLLSTNKHVAGFYQLFTDICCHACSISGGAYLKPSCLLSLSLLHLYSVQRPSRSVQAAPPFDLVGLKSTRQKWNDEGQPLHKQLDVD